MLWLPGRFFLFFFCRHRQSCDRPNCRARGQDEARHRERHPDKNSRSGSEGAHPRILQQHQGEFECSSGIEKAVSNGGAFFLCSPYTAFYFHTIHGSPVITTLGALVAAEGSIQFSYIWYARALRYLTELVPFFTSILKKGTRACETLRFDALLQGRSTRREALVQ